MRKLLILLTFSLFSAPAFATQTVPANIGDCSITSLTGSTSQIILPANAQRKYLQIFNPNASNKIFVNLSGGTAGTAASSTGTISIAAAGNITFTGSQGSAMPVNAITVNGTASDSVICLEGR